MTKTKNIKRALLASVVSLLLCLAMLVGTTFAWFTDSAISSGNIIQTGNLDIEMYWANGTEDPGSTSWTDASTGAIFNYDQWEPGYVEVRHIKIENKGSLALKYKVLIVANGEVSDLADVIDVYYFDPAVQVADRTQLTAANKIGTLTEVLANLENTGSGALTAGNSDTITIALKMQEDAGNEYQGKSIGASFSIQILATQYTSETDSFGSGYDDGATYPIVSVPVSRPAGEAVVLQAPVANAVSIELPAELVDALPAEVTAISIAHTAPKVDEANYSISFDSVEIVDQNGNVIDLEALGNAIDVNIVLPAQNTFAPGTDVIVYHDGVEAARTTVDADGTIPYAMNHLCEVTVSVPKITDIEGFKAAITGTDNTIYLDGRFEIDDLANAVGGTYIRRSLTIKGGTIVRATGNYDGLKLYNSSSAEDYLVTFEGVTFESVKGGAVIVPGANTNVNFKNCEFVNLAAPSTGNTGIKINANNVNLTFDGCTLSNMPIQVNYSYTGIKLGFTGCELNWRGTNCPGLISLYNNSVSDIDFVNCKITYDTEGATRSDSIINPKTSVGEGTTIDFDNVEIIGTSAGGTWYVVGFGGSKTQNNVVVTAQDNSTYTFNGAAVDLDTYLFDHN